MRVVEMHDIVKDYPLTRALDHVDFTLDSGSIHSLLGENGAGKSTLMKILYGMCTPDEGHILIRGQSERITNPRQAIALGIGMVHQHFMLAPVMTVAENIVVGSEPDTGLLFHSRKAALVVDHLIARYGFCIKANERVSNLSVGEQQRVEILKALYHGAEILILDEPTAVLTPQEVEELFVIMRELRKAGKSIILITHKLKETLAIADTLSVLRDGRMITSGLPIEGVSADDLARMMVGRDVDLEMTNRSKTIGPISLQVRGLTLKGKEKHILSDLSFDLHRNEILGIAGIEGNGQSELIEVLTGLAKAEATTFQHEGNPLSGDAHDFIQLKIGHVPEDRSTRGLIKEMTVEENLMLGYHRSPRFNRRGFFRTSAVRAFAQQMIKDYAIKTGSSRQSCGSLSGGNQQKVVIARVFSENPDLIIVAQPTRGVDIGAMHYIHERLFELRDQGKAILLVSADLDEVRRLSDRIAVMYDGRIVSISKPGEYSETQLGLMMTGSSVEGCKDDNQA